MAEEIGIELELTPFVRISCFRDFWSGSRVKDDRVPTSAVLAGRGDGELRSIMRRSAGDSTGLSGNLGSEGGCKYA